MKYFSNYMFWIKCTKIVKYLWISNHKQKQSHSYLRPKEIGYFSCDIIKLVQTINTKHRKKCWKNHIVAQPVNCPLLLPRTYYCMLNVIILKEILKKECQIQVNNFHRASWFAIVLPRNLNRNFIWHTLRYQLNE